MISRQFRFQGHRAISQLFKRSQSINHPAFSLRAAAAKNNQEYRVSVVISKKTAKLAVDRNLIRRRIYENLRTNFGPRLAGTDRVIIVKDGSVGHWPATKLSTELKRLIKIPDNK